MFSIGISLLSIKMLSLSLILNFLLLCLITVNCLPFESSHEKLINKLQKTSTSDTSVKEDEMMKRSSSGQTFEYELLANPLNGKSRSHQEEPHQEKPNQCFFQPDGRYYQSGATWHPYLPPFGVNKCSLCTCQNTTLQVTCRQHFTCPPLACDPEEAVRRNPTDCCKKCPDSIRVRSLDGAFGSADTSSSGLNDLKIGTSTTTGACVLSGRLYPNGHRWHPHVTPFGEIRCVKCICRNGSIKCNRSKCLNGLNGILK